MAIEVDLSLLKILEVESSRAEPTLVQAYLPNGDCLAYVVCKVCF